MLRRAVEIAFREGGAGGEAVPAREAVEPVAVPRLEGREAREDGELFADRGARFRRAAQVEERLRVPCARHAELARPLRVRGIAGDEVAHLPEHLGVEREGFVRAARLEQRARLEAERVRGLETVVAVLRLDVGEGERGGGLALARGDGGVEAALRFRAHREAAPRLRLHVARLRVARVRGGERVDARGQRKQQRLHLPGAPLDERGVEDSEAREDGGGLREGFAGRARGEGFAERDGAFRGGARVVGAALVEQRGGARSLDAGGERERGGAGRIARGEFRRDEAHREVEAALRVRDGAEVLLDRREEREGLRLLEALVRREAVLGDRRVEVAGLLRGLAQ